MHSGRGVEMEKEHGLSKKGRTHPVYKVWLDMKSRCNKKNRYTYNYYAGRGIGIFVEWNDYIKFYNWAKNKWEKGLYFDRINNDGDYTPENCRFVTPAESVHNQRLLQNHNKSGYRGVCFEKWMNMWRASIKINGRSKNLGSFKSPRIAALRYDVEAYLLNDGRPRNFS